MLGDVLRAAAEALNRSNAAAQWARWGDTERDAVFGGRQMATQTSPSPQTPDPHATAARPREIKTPTSFMRGRRPKEVAL